LAGETTTRVSRHLENATQSFREAGLALKSEFDETASVVNAAFAENGRSLWKRSAARSKSMRRCEQLPPELIEAMENRGIEAGRLIEEKGGRVAEEIILKGGNLAEKIVSSASALEATLHEKSGIIETSPSIPAQTASPIS